MLFFVDTCIYVHHHPQYSVLLTHMKKTSKWLSSNSESCSFIIVFIYLFIIFGLIIQVNTECHLLCPPPPPDNNVSKVTEPVWRSAPSREPTPSNVPLSMPQCGLTYIESWVNQNCPRQGRRQVHQDCGHHESVTRRLTEAEKVCIMQW